MICGAPSTWDMYRDRCSAVFLCFSKMGREGGEVKIRSTAFSPCPVPPHSSPLPVVTRSPGLSRKIVQFACHFFLSSNPKNSLLSQSIIYRYIGKGIVVKKKRRIHSHKKEQMEETNRHEAGI